MYKLSFSQSLYFISVTTNVSKQYVKDSIDEKRSIFMILGLNRSYNKYKYLIIA